jgi:hypothetical protein
MTLNAELKLRNRALNGIAKLQDTIHSSVQDRGAQVSAAIQKGDWHGANVPFVTNAIISAVIARPSQCEVYADFISSLWGYDPVFPANFRLGLLRFFHEATIQYLAVLLFEKGLFSPNFIIDRLICAVRPELSPEMAFYFFPELSERTDFFVTHLMPHQKRLCQWDKEYTAQCQLPLAGHDLGVDEFQVFREYRRKGQNHNPICTSIEEDDTSALTAYLAENPNVNASIPRSIFSRFNEGKLKAVSLIEYSALFGSVHCFHLLKERGAAMTPDLMGYAAAGTKSEILRECSATGVGLAPLMIMGTRNYHFSALKLATEGSSCPFPVEALREILRGKFKGLLTLMPREGIVSEVVKGADDISEMNWILMEAGMANDPFLARVSCEVRGLVIMVKSEKHEFSTVLHAVAAWNSADVMAYLSDREIDVNVDDRSQTPLVTAVRYNSVEVIRELGKVEGIDPNKISQGVCLRFR